ncbi:MAG: helix-turn-helix domain-containing protein [Wenzhouxiangellaceae bacterium]|nr:helix-turn-helix domain-containing protein [Wenzhouxiangellaceae bacterium]
MNAMVESDSQPCLGDVVRRSVRQYLEDMGSTPPSDLHAFLLDSVERPLIEVVLAHTEGNQSRAAAILGITRATLRSRIRRYGL